MKGELIYEGELIIKRMEMFQARASLHLYVKMGTEREIKQCRFNGKNKISVYCLLC